MTDRAYYPIIITKADDGISINTPIGKKPTTWDAAQDHGQEAANGGRYWIVELAPDNKPVMIYDPTSGEQVGWKQASINQVFYQLGYVTYAPQTTTLDDTENHPEANTHTPIPGILGVAQEVWSIPKRAILTVIILTIVLTLWILNNLGWIARATEPAPSPTVTHTTVSTQTTTQTVEPTPIMQATTAPQGEVITITDTPITDTIN